MSYLGYGLEKPIATNATAEGRKLNRRADILCLTAVVSTPDSNKIKIPVSPNIKTVASQDDSLDENLNIVHFDFDKSNPQQQSIPALEGLLRFMHNHPNSKIEISGHTDNVGSAAYNKPLSVKRAKIVVDYMVTKGIDQSRMTYLGFGFDKPIATNQTVVGRQMNRRAEFKILSR